MNEEMKDLYTNIGNRENTYQPPNEVNECQPLSGSMQLPPEEIEAICSKKLREMDEDHCQKLQNIINCMEETRKLEMMRVIENCEEKINLILDNAISDI